MILFHPICLSLWRASRRKTVINYSLLLNRLVRILAKRRDGWYYRTECCSTLFCVVVIKFFPGNEKTRDLMRTRREMSDNAVGSVERRRLRQGSRWHGRSRVCLASAFCWMFINSWTRNNDLAQKSVAWEFLWIKQQPSLKMWLLSHVKCLKFGCIDFAKTFPPFFLEFLTNR